MSAPNKDFDLWMGVYVPGVVCTLGIVGNIISLCVLSCDKGNYPTFFSLKALAACDIVLLSTALWHQIIPMFCSTMKFGGDFCFNMGYVKVYTWPVICVFHMNSVWLTVIISAERYSAICRPLHAICIRNYRTVRISVYISTLISVCFNIPRFFEYKPRIFLLPDNTSVVYPTDTALRRHDVYRFLYNTALYCLIIYVIPLLTLTYLNVKIARQMRAAVRCWAELNRLQQRELRATWIPLCIVIVFVVTGTQSLVSFVLDAVSVHSYIEWIQRYTAVANLLVMLNSAINFLIFYVFGSKFRRLLRHMVYCRLQALRTGRSSPIFRKRFVTTPCEPASHLSTNCQCQQSSSVRLELS